ncbi:MAG: ACT domain-containing protein [Planctomycetes bacterium]|nr:ACT domain-containing protein [Planctomycetota bacterium]
MNGKEKRHWVFRAHVADRAGALTSIASAFSNEGISIDTVVGHGTEERTLVGGSVVLTFYCTEQEKDVMVRKVKRLSKVTGLEEHPYESQSLRKSAIVSVTRKLKPRDVAGDEAFLTCEMVKKETFWTYFLAGSPSELDQILGRLAKAGVVEDIVYSIVGL